MESTLKEKLFRAVEGRNGATYTSSKKKRKSESMSSLSEKLLSKGTLGTTYLYCVYMSRIVQVSKWRRDAKIGQILSTYTPILVHDSTKKKTWNQEKSSGVSRCGGGCGDFKLPIRLSFFWIDQKSNFLFYKFIWSWSNRVWLYVYF